MNNKIPKYEIKMRSHAIFRLLVSLFMVLSFWPIQGQQPAGQQRDLESLDIQALIRESDRNGSIQHQRLPEFTYIQKRITREIGANKKLTERIREFEAYPVRVGGRHRHILSLISMDGVPVPSDQVEKNRVSAAREMEQAERAELAAPEAHDSSNPIQYVTAGIGIGADGTGVWVSASQFLHHCRFSHPRRTELGGRDMIMLAMHSCRVSPQSTRENYLEKIAGIVWIDESDKVVARIEAWPAATDTKDIFSSRPVDEIIVYDQKLIQGGIWVPRRIRLNGLSKAAIFNGVDKDITFEFRDYQHFSTEIKDPEILDPKKKPIPPQ